jgi:4-hydroxybenzoate polyprenyltransferase
MSIKPYLQIARFDHWGKNVFMLLGCLLAWFLEPSSYSLSLNLTVVLGFLFTGLVASSNYVINELLDAEQDRHHPEKQNRPVPSGQVSTLWAVVEWLLLGAAGIGGGFFINTGFGLSATALWLMGCVYNIPPVRSKELPYLDVVSESVNNPLRLLLGWFILIPGRIPPASLLVAYWMFGAFFMAIKRFAEYRHIADAERAAAYRRSFRWYDEDRLLVSCVFYLMLGSLFTGVFIVRYQLELVLFLPFASAYLAYYFRIGLQPDSPVQHPEKLFREKRLLAATVLCGVMFIALMLVEIPVLYDWFNVPESRLPPLWRLQ